MEICNVKLNLTGHEKPQVKYYQPLQKVAYSQVTTGSSQIIILHPKNLLMKTVQLKMLNYRKHHSK